VAASPWGIVGIVHFIETTWLQPCGGGAGRDFSRRIFGPGLPQIGCQDRLMRRTYWPEIPGTLCVAWRKGFVRDRR